MKKNATRQRIMVSNQNTILDNAINFRTLSTNYFTLPSLYNLETLKKNSRKLKKAC